LGRRTYIVDRKFQLKYTVILSVLGALISLMFGGMMALALRDTQLQLQSQGNLPPELVAQTGTLIWLMAGISLLMAVALAILGVMLTHRVAGPIYVMSQYVSLLAQGRYPVMRPLRRSDELKDFFERFQSAIEALRLRDEEECRVIGQVIAHVEKLDLEVGARKSLEALRAINKRKLASTDALDTGAASGKNAA
jgi:nitrogen fixation/metabolism regulation signal transduction histidine kinase